MIVQDNVNPHILHILEGTFSYAQSDQGLLCLLGRNLGTLQSANGNHRLDRCQGRAGPGYSCRKTERHLFSLKTLLVLLVDVSKDCWISGEQCRP